MDSTFLLHKPVIYGSDLGNSAFLMILVFHLVGAVVSPLAAIAAFRSRKGDQVHRHAGRIFAVSMATVAFSGLLLDAVRLLFFVEENHQKYAGYTMPSSYPARLAFVYAGICVIYLLRGASPPRVFRSSLDSGSLRVSRAALVIVGLLIGAFIMIRLNPWTGSLWMIGTFVLMIMLVSSLQSRSHQMPSQGLAIHRTGMSCIAAFCWWGALQGFAPALLISIRGDDVSTTAYVGNQPGPFTVDFFVFLLAWAPFVFLAMHLMRRSEHAESR